MTLKRFFYRHPTPEKPALAREFNLIRVEKHAVHLVSQNYVDVLFAVHSVHFYKMDAFDQEYNDGKKDFLYIVVDNVGVGEYISRGIEVVM